MCHLGIYTVLHQIHHSIHHLLVQQQSGEDCTVKLEVVDAENTGVGAGLCPISCPHCLHLTWPITSILNLSSTNQKSIFYLSPSSSSQTVHHTLDSAPQSHLLTELLATVWNHPSYMTQSMMIIWWPNFSLLNRTCSVVSTLIFKNTNYWLSQFKTSFIKTTKLYSEYIYISKQTC